MHENVERIVVQGLRGTLTLEVDKDAIGVVVIFESGGPFEAQPDGDYLIIQPVGYSPQRAPSSLHVGGNLNISATRGGIAAGVINGPVQLGGPDGPKIGGARVSGPVDGAIKIVVGTNVRSVTLEDCYGTRIGPDGTEHEMNGSRERVSMT